MLINSIFNLFYKKTFGFAVSWWNRGTIKSRPRSGSRYECKQCQVHLITWWKRCTYMTLRRRPMSPSKCSNRPIQGVTLLLRILSSSSILIFTSFVLTEVWASLDSWSPRGCWAMSFAQFWNKCSIAPCACLLDRRMFFLITSWNPLSCLESSFGLFSNFFLNAWWWLVTKDENVMA